MQKYGCTEHHWVHVREPEVAQVNLVPSTLIHLIEPVLLLDSESQPSTFVFLCVSEAVVARVK